MNNSNLKDFLINKTIKIILLSLLLNSILISYGNTSKKCVKSLTQLSPPQIQVGAKSEFYPTSELIIANSDNFGPISDFHRIITKRIPKGVKINYLYGDELLINPQFLDENVTQIESGAILPFKIPLIGSWVRDYMPEFVKLPDGRIQAVTFDYHRPVDLQAAISFIQSRGYFHKHVNLKLEGGNILVDSNRKRLFMSDSVLSKNPNYSKAQIEKILRDSLMIKEVVWLPKLPFESTGHIDIFAKLVDENVFFVATSENPENNSAMNQSARLLEELGYKVVRIENALSERFEGEGGSVFSYINSLIINRTVFVPSYARQPTGINGGHYNHPETLKLDRAAQLEYTNLGYKVVPIPMYYMVSFGGTVHCLTKGIPKF